MPFIDVRTHPAASAAQSEALAEAITAAMGRIMGKREAVTAVCVQSLPDALWRIGGGEPSAPTAFVDVKITAGTNSADQKSALIAHLHRTLSETLGSLAEASYIVVHELPATDWGYAGRTQAERAAARA